MVNEFYDEVLKYWKLKILQSPQPPRGPNSCENSPKDSPVVCISDEEGGDDELEEDLGDIFDVKEEPVEDVPSSQDHVEDDPYMSLLVPDDPPGQVSTEESVGENVGGGEAQVVASQHLAPQSNMISKSASIAKLSDDTIEARIQMLQCLGS